MRMPVGFLVEAPVYQLKAGLTSRHRDHAKRYRRDEVEFQNWGGCRWSFEAQYSTVCTRKGASACRLSAGLRPGNGNGEMSLAPHNFARLEEHRQRAGR